MFLKRSNRWYNGTKLLYSVRRRVVQKFAVPTAAKLAAEKKTRTTPKAHPAHTRTTPKAHPAHTQEQHPKRTHKNNIKAHHRSITEWTGAKPPSSAEAHTNPNTQERRYTT
jgi:hypothetical protein